MTDDFDHMSRIAADIVVKKIVEMHRKKKEAVLGLATGSSPTGLYKHLAKAANSERPRSAPLLPVLREPLLVVGCSLEIFRDSIAKPKLQGIKRIGVGSLRRIRSPLPDSHLWLDWYMLHNQLQAGKGLPL